jgi:hypothetical protein
MPGHTGYTDSCSGGFFTRFPVPMVLLSPDGQQNPSAYVLQVVTFLIIGHQFGGWMDGCCGFAILLAITVFH